MTMLRPWKIIKISIFCISAMALVSVVIGLVYVTEQQNLRQSANDPQIQISEDIALALNSGIPPTAISQSFNQINIETSLGIFVIIYNADGTPVAASGQLNGRIPVIPHGVLDHAREWGQNRRTWEPKDDVRIASVTTPFKSSGQDGYILVGRSLREVEKREMKLGLECALAWLGSMVFILFAGVLLAALSMGAKRGHT